jgi:hypothetical protein
MESNYSKIEEIRDLKNLKLIRDEAHTKIYKGIYKGKNAYIKILKNYSSRVKKHDVLKSKNELNKLGIKSFEIMAAGKIKDEKFYISEEVIGKDFEMLLNEGKTFEELKSDISITMAFFVWTVLKSLKLGAQRTNISYKILEKMIYEEYNKEFDDLLDLKKQIAFYQKVRDIKKDLKRKRKVRK